MRKNKQGCHTILAGPQLLRLLGTPVRAGKITVALWCGICDLEQKFFISMGKNHGGTVTKSLCVCLWGFLWGNSNNILLDRNK